MKYACIRAVAPAHDKSIIGFEHMFIEADDEKDAYDKSYETWEKAPLKGGQVMLNWYVFPV